VIGQVTTNGSYTSHPLGAPSDATGIAVGPDGNIWITEGQRNQIGHFDANGRIGFTPIPAADARPGLLTTDGQGGFYLAESGTKALGHVLLGLPDPALTVTALTIHGTEGKLPAGLNVARFAAPEPNARASDFRARIDFGGTQTWDGTVLADGLGGFVVQTSGAERVNVGSVVMTVTVFDVNHHNAVGAGSTALGIEAFDDAPITITPQVLSAWIGTPFTANVATFSDPGFDGTTSHSLRFSVDWGDGTADSWSGQENIANGEIQNVSASHTYTRAGSFLIVTRIQDPDGTVAATTGRADVASPTITGFPTSMTGTAGSVFDGRVGSFTYNGPPATASSFSATVTWGDGSTSPATVVANVSGGYDVLGKHTYAGGGTGTAVVSIRQTLADGSNFPAAPILSPVSIQFAAIAGSARPIKAEAGRPFSGTIATFQDANALDQAINFTATISWGDGTTSGGTVLSDGSGGFVIQGTHTYTSADTLPVSVSLSHTNASAVEATFATKATVSKAFYAIEGATLQGTSGASLSGVLAKFLDFSPSDVGSYSATVNWGDGTTSAGRVSEYGGQYVVFASHTYAQAGTMSYRVEISEGGSAAISTRGSITVAAAPPAPIGTPAAGDPVGSPATPPAPTAIVLSATSTKNKRGAIQLSLTFSSASDAALASDLSRYKITDPGRDGKIGTKDDRVVRVVSAGYNATTHVLTLTPKGTFSRKGPFRVSVKDQGVMAFYSASVRGR
jgi:hypothetical protein